MKLFSAANMHLIDQQTINNLSIPGCILMENAGRETVRLMLEKIGACANQYAPIFIGPGNNGGDGLVVGRHLKQHGCTPLFCFLSDPEKLPKDALLNYRIVEKTNLACFHLYESSHHTELINSIYQTHATGKQCYAIIDSIFGIGLQREVTGLFEQVISIINDKNTFTNSSIKPPIVACDIPSGLHADSGNILKTCVKADLTATYSFGKPGLYMNLGTEVAGDVHTLDIAIPESVTEQQTPDASIITSTKAINLLNTIPRFSDSHKGKNGHILLIAGSKGMTGAAILAAKGSLRIGTGLVSIAVTKKLNPTFEISIPEAMTLPLSSELAYFGENDFQTIAQSGENKDLLLLGPGLGNRNTTSALIKRLYQESSKPMVIDADAINILAAFPEILAKPGGPRIFTPHPGEMSRLLQTTTEQIQKDRLAAVHKFLDIFKKNYNEIVLVLKGAGSIIATNQQPNNLFLNITGNSGMATGGMGDILSGIIGGLFCQKMSLFNSALLGTYIHGMAGDRLLEEKGIGYSSIELGDRIPSCRKELAATI